MLAPRVVGRIPSRRLRPPERCPASGLAWDAGRRQGRARAHRRDTACRRAPSRDGRCQAPPRSRSPCNPGPAAARSEHVAMTGRSFAPRPPAAFSGEPDPHHAASAPQTEVWSASQAVDQKPIRLASRPMDHRAAVRALAGAPGLNVGPDLRTVFPLGGHPAHRFGHPQQIRSARLFQ